MFSVLKKISDFAGTRRGLLKKSMAVAFLGAVFAALQFAALMLTLDILVGGADLRIWPVIGVMVVSVVGRAACSYWSTNAETETGYFMVAEKRIHIGDRLRYIPMGYFNDNSLGNITAVVTTTLSDVENNAARCLVSVIGGFLNTLGLCLGLTVADWRLGLLAIAGILAYLGVTELSQRAMLKTGPARQHAQMNLVEAVLEYIQGMSVVKSYGLDKDSGQAVQRTVDESCDKALSLEKSVVPWMGLRQVVVRVFSVAIAVCALAFYSGGTLSLARCLLMLVASFMLYAELESAGNMADNLQMLGASMDKANSIDDTPVMDIDGAELTPADTSVEFQDVSFAYGDRTILDHVSLTVPSGSITAVVGPSGGGKTTLCNLIARFWDVQGGKITVGGYDVREYKLDSLMKNISMVFQSVYLFNDTVENNIKFGRPDAPHEQVVAAAKAACCHDFIMALPDGYDTVLGEGGGSLSGGEKQRISIARAMLKDAPIVILDEATASVDPENEAELQAAISALTRGKTLIMIAHRLNTVRNADQILVLSGGHIVQRGTHQELMAQGGLYADFVGVRQEALRWKLDT
ncbi:ABC transporter, ATP-binding protein [Pseudoflavonifractor capillosus ATCC 29799]|uniref:ABC transporter, ATP-binding protein n=1 Tax=Pseudoflavonifractor capillosus ATCC 29799 TaxID=411467 RepID=A6NWH1_9FIRM|nr:ABC transporter ATP-binding protein [Pseudoflavonifractor capillosus]EDM99508.1 ABC transporter, ATP-binding protein [Pseudoflavonifractor capillosus ATCC 29799]